MIINPRLLTTTTTVASSSSSSSFHTSARICRGAPTRRHQGPLAQLLRAKHFYGRMVDAHQRYEGWSHSQLVARIQELESGNAMPSGSTSSSSSASSGIKEGAEKEAPAPQPRLTPKTNGTAAAAGPSMPSSTAKAKKERRPFIVSDLPTRKIALRFAYDGASYSGLASQNDGVPGQTNPAGPAPSSLPTVESVLWNALCLARLVDPEKGMSGAGWTRCGRTDRGVSAAGQVVSLWVRSTKVDERGERVKEEERLKERERKGKLRYTAGGVGQGGSDDEGEAGTGEEAAAEEAAAASSTAASSTQTWTYNPTSNLLPNTTPDSPELPYVLSLNRLLPPTIRILDWSPVRPSFNARFDCRYRHYKYFFTTGPPEQLLPPPDQTTSRNNAHPRLDVERMREAASYLLGDHDFRNLCKVDASKQITNFRRRIDGVSIDKVEAGWPAAVAGEEASHTPSSAAKEDTPASTEEMYVLNLRGTAFLYHQVRHIMAVLLLVGARMEKPSIVKELLNTQPGQWEKDVQWLRDAGVHGLKGAVALPGSTATEVDGATAVTSMPQLKAQVAAAAAQNGHHEDEDGDSDVADVDDSALTIFDLKPQYELSADRPLVLWECGFRPCDIQWRCGSYDGDVTTSPTTSGSQLLLGDKPKSRRDVLMASSIVTSDLYRTWQRSAIATEIARHFLLAAASPSAGTKGCGTLYEEARWPFFTVPASSIDEGLDAHYSTTIPFGYGNHRPLAHWGGLVSRTREDSPQVKNERWVQGRGQRIAARRGVEKAEMLPRGGSSASRRKREEDEAAAAAAAVGEEPNVAGDAGSETAP